MGVFMFINKYNSPLGEITMTSSDGVYLSGLWIDGQSNYLNSLIKNNEKCIAEDKQIFKATSRWLDKYFACEKPNIDELKLEPMGSEFRLAVWEILCGIPYGKTMTYGEIAQIIAERRMSCGEIKNDSLAYTFKGKENCITKDCVQVVNFAEETVGKASVTVLKDRTNINHDDAKLGATRSIKISAQAVGGAVGHNPISIIIPCHRVVGKDGNLVGYGGGIELKKKLLALEGIDLSKFHDPRK